MKMHSNHVLAGRYGEIFLVEEVDSMPPTPLRSQAHGYPPHESKSY